MTKRIFRSVCIVAVVVLFASLALVMGVLYDYFSGSQENQLKTQTDLAAQGIEHEGSSYFNGRYLPRQYEREYSSGSKSKELYGPGTVGSR